MSDFWTERRREYADAVDALASICGSIGYLRAMQVCSALWYLDQRATGGPTGSVHVPVQLSELEGSVRRVSDTLLPVWAREAWYAMVGIHGDEWEEVSPLGK